MSRPDLPPPMSADQMPDAVWFSEAARNLCAAARHLGLEAPVFKRPPATPGVNRTLRRSPHGHAVVAVRVRDRDRAAVFADMVDGVVAATPTTFDDDAAVQKFRQRAGELAGRWT